MWNVVVSRRAVQWSGGVDAVVRRSLATAAARQVYPSTSTRAALSVAASRQTQLCSADRRRS